MPIVVVYAPGSGVDEMSNARLKSVLNMLPGPSIGGILAVVTFLNTPIMVEYLPSPTVKVVLNPESSLLTPKKQPGYPELEFRANKLVHSEGMLYGLVTPLAQSTSMSFTWQFAGKVNELVLDPVTNPCK